MKFNYVVKVEKLVSTYLEVDIKTYESTLLTLLMDNLSNDNVVL